MRLEKFVLHTMERLPTVWLLRVNRVLPQPVVRIFAAPGRSVALRKEFLQRNARAREFLAQVIEERFSEAREILRRDLPPS